MSSLRKLALAFLLAMSTPSCSTQQVAQRERSIKDFNAVTSSYDSQLLSRQQFDSICEVAQVREVEVVKQTPRPLRWYDYLAYASLLLLVLLLLFRIRSPAR